MVSIMHLDNGRRVLIADDINIWHLTTEDGGEYEAITLTDEMIAVIKQYPFNLEA